MVYTALDNKAISYQGNNLYSSQRIDYKTIENTLLQNRVSRVKNEEMFFHLANIDDGIFKAIVTYFSTLGVRRANLPLTTLMISSP
jgi:hypothetical protein